jgi:hypothetical protein
MSHPSRYFQEGEVSPHGRNTAVVNKIVRIEDEGVFNGVALICVASVVPRGPRFGFGVKPPGLCAAFPALNPEDRRLSADTVQGVDSGVLVSTERTTLDHRCFFLE